MDCQGVQTMARKKARRPLSKFFSGHTRNILFATTRNLQLYGSSHQVHLFGPPMTPFCSTSIASDPRCQHALLSTKKVK